MPGALRRLTLLVVTAFAALLAVLFIPGRAGAQAPLDPKAVPEPLKPWTAWALDGAPRCPVFFDHADQTRCAWPARLSLALGEHGGTFSQSWHLDAPASVPLPGDAKRWPEAVVVDGKGGLVFSAGGLPRVQLEVGEHTVRGSFAWDSLPESLAIPKETGILTLSLRGVPVSAPNRDAQGTVWFQKVGTAEEGDALGIVVHRKVIDDIPLRLVTRVELHVSGKSREELLGKALPAGFTPLALASPLPARVEPDGRLRVQVRPGVFAIELTARAEGSLEALTRPNPDGPWKEGDEVWVFEAKNDYRVVQVEGVASIDPQQTTLPEEWKRLPAYPMPIGATMRLSVSRRGDADPPPDQLTLARSLWLDFEGQGYTAQDVVTGAMNRESRLTMAPPTVLGRVTMAGRDQFITTIPGTAGTGVEVRPGDLNVSADSRIVGDPRDIPAVGWAHDFHQVTGTLNLPPGWTLLFATGVDDVPGTWVRHWSLLEIFLALMIGIVIGRLYGAPWGALALAMLVLTLPEADALEWCWLPLLALEALVRVLSSPSVRRVQRVFEWARLLAFLVVGLLALPFVVQQVRQGLHPALSSPGVIVGSGQAPPPPPVSGGLGGGGAGKAEAAKAAEAAPGSPPVAMPSAAPSDAKDKVGLLKRDGRQSPLNSILQSDSSYSRSAPSTETWQQNAAVYDPAAIVQTGPGLPRWQWTTLDLKWSGPVSAGQRLHLYLVSPAANLILALVRAALLVLIVLRVFPYGARLLPRVLGPAPTALALALVALSLTSLTPRTAAADVPDKAALDELKARLLRPPPCTPSCASSDRLLVELHGNALRLRIGIDAAAPTAVPLPGTGAQWVPADVLVDGHSADALARENDILWLALPAGRHEVVLQGLMPERASMQLSMPLKPHRVEVSATGWTVAGVHEDGLADDDLQFTRTETKAGSPGATLQPGTLPPFVTLTRTLHVGIDWEMDTIVTRVSPFGSAIVLEVPLLPGERVTTDVRVLGGKAQVFLGPDVPSLAWHSVLAQKSPLKLQAAKNVPWTEIWRMDVGSIWHASYAGIPFVHAESAAGAKIPEWRPWPGEEAEVTLTRPDGVPGQTLTIDQSTTTLEPGLRATDVTLALSLRSSRGGDHTILLPEGAQLESLTINGAAQPIRQEGRKVTIPVVPGAQTLNLVFREATGIGVVFASPAVDLGAPSVNATVTLNVPGGRWLLFTSGPRVGPAILFWSLLIVLLIVAYALGKNQWTPLRTWQWMLLLVGLSQVDIVAGGFFVGWLLALGYRNRDENGGPSWQWYNLRQIVLVAWTLVALIILAVSLHQGLLGTPEMQVTGNGSNNDVLRWFTDRTAATLPQVRIVSLPLLVYRGAMLAWALWIVLSLLAWLRWGWAAFVRGGGWKKGPKKPPRSPVNYGYAPGPPPGFVPPAPEAPAPNEPVAPSPPPPDEPKGDPKA